MPSRSEFDFFDRDPDPALDELTALAAILSGADYAYIAWMDSDRLWFKARHGFQAVEQHRTRTASPWTKEKGEPLLIQDAAKDARFSANGIDLPGARHCRSYVGIPLVAGPRKVMGTLAVLAQAPGRFTQVHLELLNILSHQVVTRLELCSNIAALEQARRARLETERALSVERLFVAATLDSIPFLAALLDTAGCLVRLNYPCMQATGLSIGDAVGLPFFDQILQGEELLMAARNVREAAAGQASGPHETLWRTRGGKTRRVSWTLRPLPGSDGEIQYLILSGQDVTEQRQAEMALLSSETRYRRLVENSLGFLFTCTLEGRLTSLNAFTAETLGYTMKDLTGNSVSAFLDPAGAATFQDGLRTLEARGEWQGGLQVRRRDGVYRRIAFRSRLMELPGERPFVLNHGIDVTEQHEAEQALQMATRQRELILESVGDGIFGIDLEGRLTFINQAAARALHYKPDQLIGRDIHALIYHSHADGQPYSRAESPILKSMSQRKTIRKTNEVFWRQDGTFIPVEYSASPLIEDGQISGMVVAFQDVSERRRLEKMKDEFISTVSHELRTPLTSLRASLGLISSGALDKRPEKQRQMAEMAIGNCDRLVRLVNDILDFDSVERGKLSLHRQPVEAIGLLRRAAEVASTLAGKAHIHIRDGAPSVRVFADEERILQVLNELVSNAIKFSPSGADIQLSAHPVGPNSGSSDPSHPPDVRFVVEDQGSGIAPEKLERIFDRFHQGDASDSRALGGTGLGLALCRSIVEQHGGRIWAESTPGKGSRFFFTLPAADGDTE
jgi:PAS domain S-box-containing protein